MFLLQTKKQLVQPMLFVFLGLELNSEKMEVRIPLHKIQEIIDRIDNFLQRENRLYLGFSTR